MLVDTFDLWALADNKRRRQVYKENVNVCLTQES